MNMPCIVRLCRLMSDMSLPFGHVGARRRCTIQKVRSTQRPILALPKPMLQAILAVRPINHRFVYITPHEVPKGSGCWTGTPQLLVPSGMLLTGDPQKSGCVDKDWRTLLILKPTWPTWTEFSNALPQLPMIRKEGNTPISEPELELYPNQNIQDRLVLPDKKPWLGERPM